MVGAEVVVASAVAVEAVEAVVQASLRAGARRAGATKRMSNA